MNRILMCAMIVIILGGLFAAYDLISRSDEYPEVSLGNGLEPTTREMKCVVFSSKATAENRDRVVAIRHKAAREAALEGMRLWKKAHPKASIITTFPVGTPPTEYYVIYVEQK